MAGEGYAQHGRRTRNEANEAASSLEESSAQVVAHFAAEAARKDQLARTQAAYAHFTLEQWKTLYQLVLWSEMPAASKLVMMEKMPSAAHG